MAKNKSEVLDKVIRFRLSSGDYERLEKKLAEVEVDMSEFCRSAVLNKRIRLSPEVKFNRDFSKIRNDFNALLEYVDTSKKLDFHALGELEKINEKLDRLLHDTEDE